MISFQRQVVYEREETKESDIRKMKVAVVSTAFLCVKHHVALLYKDSGE